MKIGTAPWMIDASPESSRFSPHERSQNGSAVFTSPTTKSQRQAPRSSASVSRAPSRQTATAASTTAAEPMRPRISVDGASCRSAILMSMNDAPQMRASSVRKTIGRRIYLLERNAAVRCEIPTDRKPRLE